MKYSIRQLVIPAVSFCFCSCSLVTQDQVSQPPEFTDQGKTADSIKQYYNCQTIEYENWEADDAEDSSLTVCLVNSTRMPADPVTNNEDEFKAIARQLKKVLAKPERYNSYYIIFVTKEMSKGLLTKSHTAGAEISDGDL